MLSTQNGSVDGIRVKSYAADTEHDLSDSVGARSLAKAFVGAGMAEAIPPDRRTEQPEQPATAGFFTPVDGEKSIEAAPENKMLKRAYNRKAK